MDINNMENHIFRIRVSLIMLFFVMCLTMNVLLYSTCNLFEFFGKTTEVESHDISESVVANEDGDNVIYFISSFNKNNSYNEIITKNICSLRMVAVIPIGISLLLFLIIVYLFFFLSLFIFLPNVWTLIRQKVRLDN